MGRTLARMTEVDADKRPASAQKVKKQLLRIRGDARKRLLKQGGLYLLGLLIGFGTWGLLQLCLTSISYSFGMYPQVVFCGLSMGYLIAMIALFATRWRMIAAGMLTLPLAGLLWLILSFVEAIW
jgi:hypothetical protein